MKNFTRKLHPWKNCTRRVCITIRFRNSCLEMFCKICVVKNFVKLKENNCARVPTPATLLKKRLWHRCFPVNFVNTFCKLGILSFIEHLRWLLLAVVSEYLYRSAFRHCQTSMMILFLPTQFAITCSKLTIETLEQGGKYLQS